MLKPAASPLAVTAVVKKKEFCVDGRIEGSSTLTSEGNPDIELQSEEDGKYTSSAFGRLGLTTSSENHHVACKHHGKDVPSKPCNSTVQIAVWG